MIKKKRVLITGATGFVGSNLVHYCLQEGAQVHAFTRITSNKWRIADVLSSVHEHCVDLLDFNRLVKAVSTIKPQIIFHTAIYGGYIFQQDSRKIIETNFIGTVNLIKACQNIDFEILVNTGASSEYGLKQEPIREGDLLEPLGDYAVSKAASTLYCQSAAIAKKIPIVTLRLFSVYGYYEEPGRLIPSVTVSSLRGEDIELSSPASVRDFIFIEDVMDAYIKVIETPGISGQIFNIGCSVQHAVGEVVNEIVKLIGNKVKPQWGRVPNLRIEPKMWQANIAKAQRILNWHPKHNLAKGLEKTVNWFRENIELYK